MVAVAAVTAAATATAEQMELKQSASTNTDFSAIEDDDEMEEEGGISCDNVNERREEDRLGGRGADGRGETSDVGLREDDMKVKENVRNRLFHCLFRLTSLPSPSHPLLNQWLEQLALLLLPQPHLAF